MLFEAELLARSEDHPRLAIETNARTWAKLEIDGVEIETAEDRQRVFGAPLQRSQKVRLLLLADNPRTIMRLEIRSDKGVTPLSTDSVKHLNKTTFLRTADQRPLVIRTSIDQLPSKSIAVIHPQGIGYAIHAPTASIVGIWTGNAFNIGPNISGRGPEPSRPEGDWLLRDPVGLALVINGKPTPFSLEKYSRDTDNPVFTSTAGKYRIQITATAVDDKSLQLSYQFIGPKPKSVALNLPTGLALSSEDGSTSDGQFQVAKDKRSAFTLTLSR